VYFQHNKGAIDWIEKSNKSNFPNRMLLCVTDGSGALLGKAFWPRLKSGNEQQDKFCGDTPKCALKGEL
jgi:hypothetical protein